MTVADEHLVAGIVAAGRAVEPGIDAGALPVTLEASCTGGSIDGATAVHGVDGVTAAQAFVTLDDGRRTADNAVDTQVPALAGTTLVGRRVRILPDADRHEVLA